MLIDIVNKLLKPVMIIACISMFITWAFGVQNVLITERNINGFIMKVVDFRLYLDNVSNAWQTNALNFDDILPPGTWIDEIPGNVLQGEFWEALWNNMAYIIQWIYFPINFVLWLDRWICWVLRFLLAIIGWNTGIDANGNYYSSLIQILDWITEHLVIPYILN